MFYGDRVQDTRKLFFTCWDKYKQQSPLQALERQIVDVILAHPEYHVLLEQQRNPLDQAYFPELGETNPFLHMGLHIAIREQIATNRPLGVQAVYESLIKKNKDPLVIEHLMMEKLAECLWLSQKNNQMPDEHLYLDQLNQLTHC